MEILPLHYISILFDVPRKSNTLSKIVDFCSAFFTNISHVLVEI